jgi:C-methyltransferase C-terminal domain/Putative zinc binding domain/Methyltransferase domain
MTRNLKCRLCGSKQLLEMLSLGEQYLTGVFPKNPETKVLSGELTLQRCEECTLVQLGHSYDKNLMYGMNYGYQSSLNDSMKFHLKTIAERIRDYLILLEGDVIVDIGSNDGTFLSFFENVGLKRIGIDPTISKFADSYHPDIIKVPEFFTKDSFNSVSDKPAKFISSISMMYDLDDPVNFALQVHDCLDDNGFWFFEQSYLGLMLEKLAYDTICHEHLEYYSAFTIHNILNRTGFIVRNIELNSINGGSIAILASKKKSEFDEHCDEFIALLKDELNEKLNTSDKLIKYSDNVKLHRKNLMKLVNKYLLQGKTISALGASTKGNVLLQYCGLDRTKISMIGDVNPDKFGCVTPGTHIPIVPESKVFELDPDIILILPWHFEETFTNKTEDFVKNGGIVIFPLPTINVLDQSVTS